MSYTGKIIFLQYELTGIPRSWGSTGWRKGKDSGSCRYSASRVGIRAWRNSSGLKTVVGKHKKNNTIYKAPKPLLYDTSNESLAVSEKV